MLIAESLMPVVMDARGCMVVSGRWYGAFTGAYFTDPSELDLTTLCPLRKSM